MFTIGVLALASGTSMRAVLVVPILWSLVGSQAAFLLDVKPDFGLLLAGAAAVGLFIWPARVQNLAHQPVRLTAKPLAQAVRRRTGQARLGIDEGRRINARETLIYPVIARAGRVVRSSLR